MAEETYTTQQAADRLGISPQYLYMLEKRGVIKAIRDMPAFSIKRKVPLKFLKTDVEALLKKSLAAKAVA